MSRLVISALLSVLTLAGASRAQSGVDLHTVRVAPRGDVVVVYSKTFATCAHMLTPSLQLVHTNNIFCTLADQVGSVHPSTAFNANFVVGNPVRLCHGNNYNQCSPLVTVSAGATLSADNWNLSLQSGGTQTFTLDAGAAWAGRSYLLLGTASGTAGFPFGPHQIPLTPDGYFFFTASNPNTFPLSGSAGALNAAGVAGAAFTLPPGLPAGLAGLVLHHAFVVLGPTTVLAVSNPWPLTFRP